MKTIKRYFIIFLSIVILVFNISIFICKPLQTKAAVVAVPAVAEIVWSLLMTAAVGVGAYEIYNNYELQKNLYDEFLSVIDSGTITLPDDGITINVDDKWYPVLTPDLVKTLKEFDAVSGGGTPPNPDDEEPPKRDEDYWQKWGKQNSFKVNGAFLGTISDFFSDIYKNKESQLYKELFSSLSNLPEYTGKYDIATGNRAYFKGVGISYGNEPSQVNASHGKFDNIMEMEGTFEIGCPVVGISHDGRCDFLWIRSYNVNSFDSYSIGVNSTMIYEDGYIKKASSSNGSSLFGAVSCNVPIFTSLADAQNFVRTGDDSKCINKTDSSVKNGIDFSQTVPNVSIVLNPLTLPQTGTQTRTDISTQNLVDILLQIRSEIEALNEAGTRINTETHNNIVNNTINNIINNTETKPDIRPEPDVPVYPDTDTGTTGEGLVKDWKLVFPFCIPFDMIGLLRAMDAEPVAPYFEIPLNIELINLHYIFELDLSVFDDVARIFRLCETVLFIAGLMLITGKVIKW